MIHVSILVKIYKLKLKLKNPLCIGVSQVIESLVYFVGSKLDRLMAKIEHTQGNYCIFEHIMLGSQNMPKI